MYRIIFSIVFSCFVSLMSIQELVGQSPEGHDNGVQGDGQPSPHPDVPPQPAGEQPPDAPPMGAPPMYPPPPGAPPMGMPPGVQPPAGEQPAEAPTTPPTRIPPTPANSLIILAHPDIAGKLGLNNQQRAEIERIISVQRQELIDASLARATEERYQEIYKQNEEKLSNVLTVTQRTVLPKVISEQKIRINFKFQAWKDVLQWIADQAAMQLVMIAPPPGTFNYADQEERTVTEAIDLINQTLITDHYTLLRDGRTLMVVDLKKRPPNRVFPSVQPEELPERGSFDYISVLFLLERRNREQVVQGIEPFRTDYTRVIPMPGNNLLIIDTAEALRDYQRIINSVENPPVPPPPPPPPPPPQPPEWKAYILEKNTPDKILEIFKLYVEDIKTLPVSDPKKLRIFARPDQHAQLEIILKMLEEDAGLGTSGQAITTSYPIAKYLESNAPFAGGFRGQGPGRRWQEGGGVMMPPGVVLPPGIEPNMLNRMQIFGLELITILKRSFPKAVVSDIPVLDQIVITATADEHEQIVDFLDLLRPSPESQLVLKLYRYTDSKKKMTDTTVEQLRTLLPSARFDLHAQQGQILVVATAKEHDILEAAVKELEMATQPTQDKILETYMLARNSLSSFQSLVQQLVAQDKLRGYYQLEDAQRSQVLIWATAEQHKLIDKVYVEVTGQSPQSGAAMTADTVVTFTPKNIDIETLTMVLEDIYPTAKITQNPLRKQVIIRVRAEQKEPLELLLQQLDADDPEEEKRYFDTYPLEVGFYSITSGYDPSRPQQFVAELEKVAPGARINWDTASQQLIVWGTKEEHAKIKTAIQNLIGDGKDKVIDWIQLRRKYTWDILPILYRMFPSVEFTSGRSAQELIIEGHSKLLPKVVELINLLDPEEPTERDPYVMFYQFEQEPTDTVIQGLYQLAHAATIIQDHGSKQIMVIAKSADHKIIEKNTELIVKSFATPEKEVRKFQLRRFQNWQIASVLERKFPEAQVTYDYYVPGTIIVEGDPVLMPKVAALLELLEPGDAIVMFYSLKAVPTFAMLQGLRQVAPSAYITLDWNNWRIMVIAPLAEQKLIEKNAELISQSFAEPEMIVERFEPRRMAYWQTGQIINQMFPTARVYYDEHGQYLVVEAYPELMPRITELVELVDPKEPSESDPVVKFYALSTEPTEEIVAGLQHISQNQAYIAPDRLGKQIMVIAKPAIQKIIEENTKIILSSFTPPEEPVLVIYTVTNEERDRLEKFIDTAKDTLRGEPILSIPETTPEQSNRFSIWARPTEHKLIATVLKQIKESQANAPERKLKSFPMSIGDMTTAQNILKASHPDAVLFASEADNRLLVWATPDELKKVAATLEIQGSIDDREMIVYTVVGVKPEAMKTVIKDVFQGLKITEEERKLLIWASPNEHVTIAEMVEKANKEVDPDSELAESFVAHSTANIDTSMVMQLPQLFQTMIPDASVYADTAVDKIVVRARTRDHKKITELFEQLREKDERMRPTLKVYIFDEVPPVMIEAMLRNQLPNAQSMTPSDVVFQLGYQYYYEDMPYTTWDMYGNRVPNIRPKKTGYYKVDPQNRTVHVFVTGEQHKIVGEAMEQLLAAGNQGGVKLTVKRYSMSEIQDFYDVQRIIRRIAPNALYQQIWVQVPYSYSFGNYSYSGYSWRTTGDFLAYTSESEHEKLEALMNEINDTAGVGRKELLTIILPDQSPYPKEIVVEMIQRMYSDVDPMAGGTVNQILVWAVKQRLEQIQKMVSEVCQPLPEGERTIVKTYPLLYISIDSAMEWLSGLYPNAAFNPEKLTTVGHTPGPPRPQDFQRTDEGKFIVVVATPLEHVEIEKTIKELDQDLPASLKMVQRNYSLDDLPAGAFEPFSSALQRAFPNTALTAHPEGTSVMVVAIEDDHKKVAEFIKTFRDDVERTRPELRIYTVKQVGLAPVFMTIRRVLPAVYPTIGSKPDQITVWATPKEHADIEGILSQLEAAAEGDKTPHQTLQIYRTGAQKAQTAGYILSNLFPGTLVFPTGPSELAVWASPADQETIAHILKSVAETFPDRIAKPYFFKHIPLSDGLAFLRQTFPADMAQITSQPSGDLLIFADPMVHEQIAASIKLFDIPRPADSEYVPRSYDLSSLIIWEYGYLSTRQIDAASRQIQAEFGERVRIMPSAIIQGQLVVYAKPADQEKISLLIAQILADAPGAKTIMLPYTLNHGNAHNIYHMVLREIVPSAQHFTGATPNQVLVFAKESEHIKIKDAFDKMNQVGPDVSMQVYPTGAGQAATAVSLIQRQFPNLIVQSSNPNEIVAWVSAAEHETITDMLKTFVEAYPERVTRRYFFKHFQWYEGMNVLRESFSQMADITYNPNTSDVIIHASLDVHNQIAAAIAEFDIPQPAESERKPKTYDMSDLAPWQFQNATSQIQAEFGSRIQVMYSPIPGQFVVNARQPDHEKIDAIVKQLLADAPATKVIMRDYTVNRGNAMNLLSSMIAQIAPSAVPYYGSTPNQILVGAKAADHLKIEEAVNKLNRSETDITLQRYWTGTEKASMAQTLLLQQFPSLQTQLANQSELVAWVSPAEHEEITEMLKTFVEAYPERVMRLYHFKHFQWWEGLNVLHTAFSQMASITYRGETGEVIVYASPEVHDLIAASIAEFDVPQPAGTERLPKSYDLSDLVPWQFQTATSHIQSDFGQRIRVMYSPVPGQFVVLARPADHEKIGTIVEQLLADAPATKVIMRDYTVNRGNAMNLLSSMIAQIAPSAVPYYGSTPNQILVGAKAADHLKIEETVDKLNRSETDVTLQRYWTGTERAATAQTLLQQQFPGLQIQLANPSELVAWVSSTEHEEITEMLKTFVEAYPERIMKPYYFKHRHWLEGWEVLNQAFTGLARVTYNNTTGDVMVYARPDVHRQVVAAIAEFDIPRPAESEQVPRFYDLSDLPDWQIASTTWLIPQALNYLVSVTRSVIPGQIVVWGKESEQVRAKMLIDGMRDEHPAATASMRVYTLKRSGNTQSIMAYISQIAPHSRPTLGAHPNQIAVLAKASDHRKIDGIIESLNEAEPDIRVEFYPLKNIHYLSVTSVLSGLRDRRGLDIMFSRDMYGDQLIVMANPENQKIVSDILDDLRAEDRDLLVVVLQNADAQMAKFVIESLFYDESEAGRAICEIDLTTNTLTVHGIPRQLERARQKLIQMGEDIPPLTPANGQHNVPTPDTGLSPKGNIRTITGSSAELLQELEKTWRQQMEPNPLRIIPKKEETSKEIETPSLYSLEDEVQRESTGEKNTVIPAPDQGRGQTPAGIQSTEANPAQLDPRLRGGDETDGDDETDGGDETSEGAIDAPAPIYILSNADGSLTISSADTEALDRLESLLKRIASNVVHEGRDYTIFAVRNTNATLVRQKLLYALQSRMRQQATQQYGVQTRQSQVPLLEFFADETSNTISARGTKADRQEVGRLIALFDVSDLPGEWRAKRPISVPIKNAELSQVYDEIMKVYRNKLRMTPLPGGGYPQIIPVYLKNSLEIIAPEPLATELKEYAEEIDAKALEEPARKIHVIPLNVKATVIEQALNNVRRSQYYNMMMQMRMQQMQQMQMGMPNYGGGMGGMPTMMPGGYGGGMMGY